MGVKRSALIALNFLLLVGLVWLFAHVGGPVAPPLPQALRPMLVHPRFHE
ncbi:MAG: hypothetical protein U0350_39870 [Caldilineaceae bacterium]